MPELHHVQHAGSHCPRCKDLLDCTAHAAGKKLAPTPGDLTICFGCLALLVFDDRMQLVEPSPDVVAGMSDSLRKDIERARALVRREKGH